MKLVVFAHTPPPMHGQSYMVAQMLQGFQDESLGVQTFHVNARLSHDLEDVGVVRGGKIFRLLKFCWDAIRVRLRRGITSIYYIPSPPKRGAFYRDCIVFLFCRPFFRNWIFHWEASGLAEWLQNRARPWERWLARHLFPRPALSVVVSSLLSGDAEYFHSGKTAVVPNAIGDPCPDFEEIILPLRAQGARERRQLFEPTSGPKGGMAEFRLVFLAHCTPEKGLFIALQAVALANAILLKEQVNLRMRLTIAGAFLTQDDRDQFENWQRQHPQEAEYAGFLDEEAKRSLLRRSDGLCFPTYYPPEAQPVSVIEAMAFGLFVVASTWRGIPELLPNGYPFLVESREPEAYARALLAGARADYSDALRKRYCENFTTARYAENLARAFKAYCPEEGS